MESKKSTGWIILTCILTVLVILLTMAWYRSWKAAGDLQIQLAESQNHVLTTESEQKVQAAAAADHTQAVRVMNGILQQQTEDGQWVDMAPVAELQQADPVLAGRTRMEEVIAQNREAVQNGTKTEEELSPLMGKKSNAVNTLASASRVQTGINKTSVQSAKTQSGGTTVAIAPTATTPSPEKQPTINNSSDSGSTGGGSSDSGSTGGGSSDSGSTGGGSSDSGSTGGGSSDSGSTGGGSSDSGSTGGGSSDSGSTGGDSSDSGSTGGGSSDSGSTDSGDGEDIGWTDEVL